MQRAQRSEREDAERNGESGIEKWERGVKWVAWDAIMEDVEAGHANQGMSRVPAAAYSQAVYDSETQKRA